MNTKVLIVWLCYVSISFASKLQNSLTDVESLDLVKSDSLIPLIRKTRLIGLGGVGIIGGIGIVGGGVKGFADPGSNCSICCVNFFMIIII